MVACGNPDSLEIRTVGPSAAERVQPSLLQVSAVLGLPGFLVAILLPQPWHRLDQQVTERHPQQRYPIIWRQVAAKRAVAFGWIAVKLDVLDEEVLESPLKLAIPTRRGEYCAEDFF
jgi:hypothetical protein